MEMESCKLFIGGISWETSEDRLRDYFHSFGEVLEAVIMKDRATGRARGFGFVVFADPNVAERVVLLKHIIDGKIVEAKKAVPRDDHVVFNKSNSSLQGSPGPSNSKKIFVGGLASSVTEAEFKKYFAQFGMITDVVVMYDHRTQRPRGFGFISYDSEEAVDKVLQKTFHELNGKMVEVNSFLVGVLRDMWESICLTLAATAGNNIGKVLQKKGTIILPPLSLKLKVLRAYAENKPWALGFLMDIVGALLMLRALSLAPVSVVQPVSGCGLAILSVFSHFYLKEVMNVFDWIGITVAGIGTIGVGAGGEEQEASLISVFQLLWLALVVAILFVLLNAWLHIFKRQRREQELGEYEVVEEIIYGLESGILFGMASVVSKMGFVFVEQGFSTMFIPMCISISICCSGTGFFYQTRGLKHGRAIVVSTCAAVASIVTGVVAGMFALGEKLPTSPSGRLLLLLGWLLIMLGVVLLVTSSRLIRHLPRSFRRSRQTSLERGFNIRRTTSHTPKDTNPSAVIQAATLHHLLSSPSKDKD